MSSHRRTVEDEFYSGHWSCNIETSVLDKLVVEWRRGNWIPGMHAENYVVVKQARIDLIKEQGVWIPIKDYYSKVAQWDARFHNFNWLLNHGGVLYYEDENFVHANKRVWNDIAAERPEVMFYKEEGEINWKSLSILFKEIITISDTNESEGYKSSVLNDEVEQPKI